MAEKDLSRRDAVLELLRGADAPMTVEEVAQALGAKTSTARADLEMLRASGGVEREALPRAGRGRPRWGYTASVVGAHPYETLARALAHHISDDPSVADLVPEEIADEWLSRIPRHEPAATPDEAVEQAARSLESLGFAVDVNPIGTEITMTGCPYADMVSDFPMICDIHGALLRGILADAKQGVEVERIDVWARPGMCVAALARSDIRPQRTITTDDMHHLTPGGTTP